MRAAILLAVVAVACKRTDPHAGDRAAVAPPAAAGDVVAGSLVAPTIEAWFGVMLPAPLAPARRAALEEHARLAGFAKDGARWLVVKDSDPAGAGYTASSDAVILHVPDPDRRAVQATTVALVIGAGGPSAELDAIHGELVALARQAATDGHGWILDEQTAIMFDVAGFDAGPARSPRDVPELIAFDISADAVQTMGMDRFGLPELRVPGADRGTMATLRAPLHAAAQALVDHGGLSTDGVLDAGGLRWTVDWAATPDDQPKVLQLTSESVGLAGGGVVDGDAPVDDVAR